MPFVFRPIPTAITAVMLVVLCGLGTWQLQRLGWKEQLIATIETRRSLPPAELAPTLASCAANLDDCAYVPVTVQGQFGPTHPMRMPMISLAGQGGYALLAPFQLADGRWLLVNRGWTPYQAVGQDFPAPIGPLTLKGLLRLPPNASWLTPANQPGQGIWYSHDLTAMARQAGIPEFLPLVLDADATPNLGGLPLGGQTRLSITNNHLSYALTWYGLAMTLLVIYGVSCWKREARS